MQTHEIEIIPVTRKNSSLRWKWRHVDPDGQVKESKEEYALYYECVTAARASGYRPNVKCA